MCLALPLTHLQIFLEDAGFDWKILGPDVSDFDYVAWQVRWAWFKGVL